MLEMRRSELIAKMEGSADREALEDEYRQIVNRLKELESKRND
jgi:hypothetical protein